MKIFANVKVLSAVFALGLLAVGGCSDSSVRMVKEGAFEVDPDTSIGELMSKCFDDIKWTSRKTPSGGKVVFTGKINKVCNELAAKQRNADMVAMRSEFMVERNYEYEYPELHKLYNEEVAKSGYLKDIEQSKHLSKQQYDMIGELEKKFQTARLIDYDWKLEKLEEQINNLKSKPAKTLNEWEVDELKDATKTLHELKNSKHLFVKLDEITKKIEALKDGVKDKKIKAMDLVMSRLFFPVGSEVEFVWNISKDGKQFTLHSMRNNSWDKFHLLPKGVLTVLSSN